MADGCSQPSLIVCYIFPSPVNRVVHRPQWQSPKTPNKTGGVNWTPPQPTQGNFARPQQQWGPMVSDGLSMTAVTAGP